MKSIVLELTIEYEDLENLKEVVERVKYCSARNNILGYVLSVDDPSDEPDRLDFYPRKGRG